MRRTKRKKPMFRGDRVSPLLRALARAGMTARDLAKKLGVSERTVGRWLADVHGMTTLNKDAVRAVLGADAC